MWSLSDDGDENWRNHVGFEERYKNIRIIGLTDRPELDRKTAAALEQELWNESLNLREYREAVANNSYPVGHSDGPPSDTEIISDADMDDPEGITIGPYEDCIHIGQGASADVYRSDLYALKVWRHDGDLQPHSIEREAEIIRILNWGHNRCISLVKKLTYDSRPVLVMPYLRYSLETILEGDKGPNNTNHYLTRDRVLNYFTDIFSALKHVHSLGIIHRDIKPSSILLERLDGPVFLSDFGTAWHPELSLPDEPADKKCLDIGTGSYRAPETLFTNEAYGTAVDIWAAGALLGQCARRPPREPLFRSRAAHEDGNQLGLILDIFKKLGTPTRETWPEAEHFPTPPFDMYNVFPRKPWNILLPDVDRDIRRFVAGMLKFQSTERLTAAQALEGLVELGTPPPDVPPPPGLLRTPPPTSPDA